MSWIYRHVKFNRKCVYRAHKDRIQLAMPINIGPEQTCIVDAWASATIEYMAYHTKSILHPQHHTHRQHDMQMWVVAKAAVWQT